MVINKLKIKILAFSIHLKFYKKMKRKIILAGGSGFLGQILSQHFSAQGDEVIIFSRSAKASSANVRYQEWDGKHLGKWAESLEQASVLINLTGKSVNCRYNAQNKAEIYASRLESTAILGEALRNCQNPPPLWLNASSATIYRHALDKAMDEAQGEFGEGFSVDVCQQWEAIFWKQETANTRKVALRLAMVLGKSGGVMKPFKNLVRMGLGGTQGSGKQYISWLHETDFIAMIEYFMQQENLEGNFNCSSPNPVPNRAFMQALRAEMKMPIGLPANKLMLEIGAVFMQTETELILKSRRVVPRKLLETGFTFRYPHIKEAFADLC